MPRLINANPRYRHHRASGQAVVTIAGRDYYLGPWRTNASKAEYDRVLGEWLAAGRRLPGTALADITVGEVAERFWQHAQGYYIKPDGSPTNALGHIKQALKYLNRLYGRQPAREFGPLALENVRNSMIDADWCRTYVNTQVGNIKMIFKWAVAKQLVEPALFQALSAVAGLRAGKSAARESRGVRPVADKIINATLAHCSSVVRAMIELQRVTGARPGEICAMRIGEIDRTGDVWAYTPATHKNAHRGQARVIYVGNRGQAILQPFLMKLDPTAYVFSPAQAVDELRRQRSEARKTPLHYGNRPGSNVKRRPHKEPGDHYDVHSYRRAIRYACDAAFDIPPNVAADPAKLEAWRREYYWHPHQLRHNAATLIRRQFGIEAAQHVLGHATLSAAQIYAEKSTETARQIAAAIG